MSADEPVHPRQQPLRRLDRRAPRPRVLPGAQRGRRARDRHRDRRDVRRRAGRWRDRCPCARAPVADRRPRLPLERARDARRRLRLPLLSTRPIEIKELVEPRGGGAAHAIETVRILVEHANELIEHYEQLRCAQITLTDADVSDLPPHDQRAVRPSRAGDRTPRPRLRRGRNRRPARGTARQRRRLDVHRRHAGAAHPMSAEHDRKETRMINTTPRQRGNQTNAADASPDEHDQPAEGCAAPWRSRRATSPR